MSKAFLGLDIQTGVSFIKLVQFFIATTPIS